MFFGSIKTSQNPSLDLIYLIKKFWPSMSTCSRVFDFCMVYTLDMAHWFCTRCLIVIPRSFNLRILGLDSLYDHSHLSTMLPPQKYDREKRIEWSWCSSRKRTILYFDVPIVKPIPSLAFVPLYSEDHSLNSARRVFCPLDDLYPCDWYPCDWYSRDHSKSHLSALYININKHSNSI